VLSAVICLIRFLGTKRWYYYFAHLFLFLLALLTKEAAVVMIVLGLYYLHFIAKEKMFSFNARVFVAGWLAVAVPWFLLRQAVLANNPLKLTAVEAGRSLLRNLPVIIQSLGKILFPFNLSVMPTIRDTSFLYGAVALFLLGLAWFLTRSKRYGFVFFGLLWSFLFILPPFIIDFSLVPTHLESRMYLPLIGVLLVLLELEPIRGLQLMKRSVLIYFVLLLAVFSLTTFIYSGNFADRIVFWTNAAQTSPHSPLAHRNLGAMYYLDGQLDKAEPEYQKALELNPVEPMAHNNLGLIYLGRGGLKEAEAEFVKELEINPCYDNALFNLGLLYAREGRFKKARVLWEKTLQVNPGYNDARSYLRLIHGK
jgi:tetratricopeptide (TPR) repeat protein